TPRRSLTTRSPGSSSGSPKLGPACRPSAATAVSRPTARSARRRSPSRRRGPRRRAGRPVAPPGRRGARPRAGPPAGWSARAAAAAWCGGRGRARRAPAAAAGPAAGSGFAAARLVRLRSDPPGLYADVAHAGDSEEATWLCLLIAYLQPLDDDEPWASITAAR